MILRNLDLPRLYDPFLIASCRPALAYIGRIREREKERFCLRNFHPRARGLYILDNFHYLSIVFASLPPFLLFSRHMFVYVFVIQGYILII